jgi:hypothetical protein
MADAAPASAARAEIADNRVGHPQCCGRFVPLSHSIRQSFISDSPEQGVHLHGLRHDTGLHDLPRMLQLVGECHYATLERHAPLKEHSQILRSRATVQQRSLHPVAQGGHLFVSAHLKPRKSGRSSMRVV